MARLLFYIALVAWVYFGCGKSPPQSSGETNSPEVVAQNRPSVSLSSPANSRAAPGSERENTEEPAWLEAALDDPNPKVRIQALDYWSEHPGEKLDPVTKALVDPDERVRARAQEVFEEALARR